MPQSHYIDISLPASPEYIAVARLAVSGVAAWMGFTVDKIDDIKMALSEACLNVVQYAYENQEGRVDIRCVPHKDELEIIVIDTGKGFDLEKTALEMNEKEFNLGLGLMFIKSLMDEMEIKSEIRKGTQVRMVKQLSSHHHHDHQLEF